MNTTPKSACEKVGGMHYFPRMLDKMRLHGRGELRADFHKNLGEGADKWCCHYLRVSYADLREKVLAGLGDEDALAWCFEHGRRLDETDLFIWNQFITKVGWNDPVTPYLQRLKKQSGLAERADIETMVQYFDVDEGRKP
jgi:gluconokinase